MSFIKDVHNKLPEQCEYAGDVGKLFAFLMERKIFAAGIELEVNRATDGEIVSAEIGFFEGKRIVFHFRGDAYSFVTFAWGFGEASDRSVFAEDEFWGTATFEEAMEQAGKIAEAYKAFVALLTDNELVRRADKGILERADENEAKAGVRFYAYPYNDGEESAWGIALNVEDKDGDGAKWDEFLFKTIKADPKDIQEMFESNGGRLAYEEVHFVRQSEADAFLSELRKRYRDALRELTTKEAEDAGFRIVD